MTPQLAIALYFVIWWITLFAVLPFNVRSQSESGSIVHGTDPGAPTAPGLGKKALITTAVSAVIFAVVMVAWRFIEL